MDVHDRGMLYYRLLKHDIQEARRVVCGEHKMVASKNTIIPRVSALSLSLSLFPQVCFSAISFPVKAAGSSTFLLIYV